MLVIRERLYGKLFYNPTVGHELRVRLSTYLFRVLLHASNAGTINLISMVVPEQNSLPIPAEDRALTTIYLISYNVISNFYNSGIARLSAVY
jgi:hypothetical protein